MENVQNFYSNMQSFYAEIGAKKGIIYKRVTK